MSVCMFAIHFASIKLWSAKLGRLVELICIRISPGAGYIVNAKRIYI